MLIKKLTLENFRQFKDRETIEFSYDKDANITLILGDNTSGKTTILQSFLWCLYGNRKITFKSKDQLYNEEIALEMKQGEKREIRVTMEVNHSNTEYIIERKQECVKSGDSVRLLGTPVATVYYKTADNQTKKVDEIDTEDVIKDILPMDLSEYFFYDTERFGNITDKKDVTESVKGLLGLKLLENAIEHLGRRTQSQTVVGRLYNELNHEGNENINNFNREIDDLQQKIKSQKELIQINLNNKEKYESEIKEKENALKASENTRIIQNKIETKRNEMENITNQKNREKLEFIKEFRRDTLSFFIKPLLRETHAFVESTNIKEVFIRGMHADSIEDIISREVCVCGTKIVKDSPEYQELQNSLKVIPPQSIGMLVDKHQTFVRNEINREVYLNNEIENKYQNLIKHRLNINELDHYIQVKEEEIKGLDAGLGLQNTIDDIRKNISRIDENVIRSEFKIKDYTKEIEKLEKKISNHLQINEHNEEVLTLLKYAEGVTEWFQNDYDRQHAEIRSSLEKNVNHYFKKIYHGEREVKIDESYKVTLYDKDNKHLVTDESAGLETVKNFSYIAGLVELAKEKMEEINRKTDRNTVDEEYPLVLDAPFSNVDEEHVINISNILPTVTRQLILIVMEKDWYYAEKELNLKVGKTYRLNKHTELYTTIEQEWE